MPIACEQDMVAVAVILFMNCYETTIVSVLSAPLQDMTDVRDMEIHWLRSSRFTVVNIFPGDLFRICYSSQ